MNRLHRYWLLAPALLAVLIAYTVLTVEGAGQSIEELLALEAGDIDTLCIVENYECSYEISAKDQIASFLDAVADVEEYTYRKASEGELGVDVRIDPQKMVLQSRFRPEEGFAFGLIGYDKKPGTRIYRGAFKSIALKGWLEDNVE